MKKLYIIEVDEKRYEEIKQIANAQLELKNKTEAQIIANGTPYNPTGDCISRSDLRKTICGMDFDFGDYYDHTDEIIDCICEKIDNAQAVEAYTYHDVKIASNNGYVTAMKEYARPQGQWIKEDDEHLKGWYRCSECGRRVEDLTDDVVIHAGCEDYTIADIYPYCHCGADMRKGGAENEIRS